MYGRDEKFPLCIASAKVCWVVLKKDKTLARIEGNGYKLPLGVEDRVEVDLVMSDIKLFDVYHEKDKILVLIEQKDKEPISFMIQGIGSTGNNKKTPQTTDTNTITTPTK